jgi:ribosome-associated translation inhibitor RaiA
MKNACFPMEKFIYLASKSRHTAMEEGGSIELGGNISLVGFKDVEPAEMVVVKKVVGNYSKRISEMSSSFKKITVSMKKIHGPESHKYEMACKLDADKVYNSEVTEFNLFVALDSALKKIVSSLG